MIPNVDLLGHILDNECAPKSPLVIKLHCVEMRIHWHIVDWCAHWNDYNQYIPNKYEIDSIDTILRGD